MFKPSEVVISAYLDHLDARLLGLFPEAGERSRHTLRRAGRLLLGHTARTDALYTNLEGTLHRVEVLLCILEGRQQQQTDLAVQDWLHLVVAALAAYTGFARGSLPGDGEGEVSAGSDAGVIALGPEQTDGCLLPVFIARSQAFVRLYLRNESLLDPQAIADSLGHLEFPVFSGADEATADAPGDWLNAAQLVSQLGDPRFHQRLPRLFRQLQEAGVTQQLEVADMTQLRRYWARHFWERLLPRVAVALPCLQQTGDGELWLARMNGHLLAAEHPDALQPVT